MTALCHAVRTLLKTPSFTVIALVTLALGIGVNTSMYTLMDVLLFRSAPFPEPDRLVVINGTSPQSQRDGFSFVEIEEMRAAGGRDGSRRLERFRSSRSPPSRAGATPCPSRASRRSASRPSTRPPTSSRPSGCSRSWAAPFTAEEGVPGRNRVALLSYDLWQARFGADPGRRRPDACASTPSP